MELLTADYFPASQRFSKIAPSALNKPFESQLLEYIEFTRMEGLLQDLVVAAQERRPRSDALAQLAGERGLTLTGPRLDNPTGQPLEALIAANAKFIHPTPFIERLANLAGQVCWIDIPDGGGTGFLVANDLVLTNQHVVAPLLDNAVSPADVRCWFDHKEPVAGSFAAKPTRREVPLKVDAWLVDKRPPSPFDFNPALGDAAPGEVDSALIRLAVAIGEMPLGGPSSDPASSPRGFIDVSQAAPAVAAGNQVFLLQHPKGEPLQMAIGTIKEFNGNGTRVRYDANSKNGSSGGPCLNADLQLVALHHAHDLATPPQWNQGIPFGVIQKVWADDGVAVA
jgi:S1-C subfamily serine protease